jgi:competence protein ComEA
MNLFKTLLVSVLLAFAVSGFATEVVDINHADAQALEQLQGVGPAKALAIVAYREANGPFATIEDLAKVQGIGLRTVEINRALMSVGATPLAAKPGPGN